MFAPCFLASFAQCTFLYYLPSYKPRLSYFAPNHRFSVYDSVSHSPARFLLPARDTKVVSSESPLAGSPGRWALQADMSEMNAVAHMFNRIETMADVYVSEEQTCRRQAALRACFIS